MGKIFYAVSGEGRGHATRARALVEDLRQEHEVVLYAPDLAYDVLAPFYGGTDVEVREIPGLRFYYNGDNRLDYVKTGLGNLGYLTDFPQLARRLMDDMERETPALVITDFEPALPRAAQRCGIPFLSLDHQHFLLTYDLSSLPLGLRAQVAFMAPFTQAFYQGQEHTIVSSFYFPPLKPGLEDVTQIGVLLRPEILGAERRDDGHLVAYLRRFSDHRVLQALADSGVAVRVYGLGAQPARGALCFREVDMMSFVEDLATCRALVTTAGNQLVGEALYLGKPVLAMPEKGNYEQEINAHFLAQSGAGVAIDMNSIDGQVLRRFLDRHDSLAARIDRERLCGNPVALEIVRRFMPPANVVRMPVPIMRPLSSPPDYPQANVEKAVS